MCTMGQFCVVYWIGNHMPSEMWDEILHPFRWSFEMGKYFHPTHYNGCNHISMLSASGICFVSMYISKIRHGQATVSHDILLVSNYIPWLYIDVINYRYSLVICFVTLSERILNSGRFLCYNTAHGIAPKVVPQQGLKGAVLINRDLINQILTKLSKQFLFP